MKFNSTLELLKFLEGKDYSTLDFIINEDCTSDGCSLDDAPIAVSSPEKVNVEFNSFFDNPSFEFEQSNESVLVVEDFEFIPGTCSTSSINLFGRTVIVGICESNGLPTAKFNVTIDGKKYVGKEFYITKDKSVSNKILI